MSTELAYLAGFFDGEGTIGVHKSGHGGKYSYFRMAVSNTNREIIQMFQDRFGGSVGEKRPEWASNRLQKKMMWTWTVCGDQAWDCYYALRPFLKEKLWKDEPVG